MAVGMAARAWKARAGARVARNVAVRAGFSDFPLANKAAVDPDGKGRAAAEAVKVTFGAASAPALVSVGIPEAAFEDKKLDPAAVEALPQPLQDVALALAADAEFEGKAGSSALARLAGGADGPKALQLVGVGAKVDAQALGAAAAAAAACAKEVKAATAELRLCGDAPEDAAAVGEAVALGALTASYEDTRFKAEGKPTPLTALSVVAGADDQAAAFAEGAARGKALAQGRFVARDLVNAPPNWATPAGFAQAAADIAAVAPDTVSLTVLEKEECIERGMGAYLGVANGSDEPPKFIHLHYKPAGETTATLALVGKGVTFDSGGYNLKVGGMIELMKFDCGGAAACLGAMRTVAELQPEGVELHVIVAACENMIGGDGLRPGDVLCASNGKTIEIINTDAEGRLTLADALIYAGEREGVQKIVDVATLTGAMMVALGDKVAGGFTDSDEMYASLEAASKRSGEKLWRMPLETGYAEQLKSPCADIKNLGGRFGGAITAGLFLKEFVPKDVEWAHLDIAGPVWDHGKSSATGYASALLASWVLSHSE